MMNPWEAMAKQREWRRQVGEGPRQDWETYPAVKADKAYWQVLEERGLL